MPCRLLVYIPTEIELASMDPSRETCARSNHRDVDRWARCSRRWLWAEVLPPTRMLCRAAPGLTRRNDSLVVELQHGTFIDAIRRLMCQCNFFNVCLWAGMLMATLYTKSNQKNYESKSASEPCSKILPILKVFLTFSFLLQGGPKNSIPTKLSTNRNKACKRG